jgi:S1/P1 Nuclease
MKSHRLLTLFLLFVASVILISWGATGHRTVAKIAENHLTPQAKAAVLDLLGAESMSDVSSWADQVRNKPEYRYTTPWHYINMPLGLSYAQFQQMVDTTTSDNVYNALHKLEAELANPATPREKRIDDLKFIIHFVGDLHQPMHVSRSEDKGGNTIQLNYQGSGTNLHSVWDGKLIDRQGLSYEQMANQYDHVSPAQVKQWQNDPLVLWLWESYTITTKLYAEVDAMKSRNIDSSYYEAHIPIVQQRITQGGIRLAGVLNTIFENYPVGEKK